MILVKLLPATIQTHHVNYSFTSGAPLAGPHALTCMIWGSGSIMGLVNMVLIPSLSRLDNAAFCCGVSSSQPLGSGSLSLSSNTCTISSSYSSDPSGISRLYSRLMAGPSGVYPVVLLLALLAGYNRGCPALVYSVLIFVLSLVLILVFS